MNNNNKYHTVGKLQNQIEKSQTEAKSISLNTNTWSITFLAV